MGKYEIPIPIPIRKVYTCTGTGSEAFSRVQQPRIEQKCRVTVIECTQ